MSPTSYLTAPPRGRVRTYPFKVSLSNKKIEDPPVLTKNKKFSVAYERQKVGNCVKEMSIDEDYFRGSLMTKVVPLPGMLKAFISPLWACTIL